MDEHDRFARLTRCPRIPRGGGGGVSLAAAHRIRESCDFPKQNTCHEVLFSVSSKDATNQFLRPRHEHLHRGCHSRSGRRPLGSRPRRPVGDAPLCWLGGHSAVAVTSSAVIGGGAAAGMGRRRGATGPMQRGGHHGQRTQAGGAGRGCCVVRPGVSQRPSVRTGEGAGRGRVCDTTQLTGPSDDRSVRAGDEPRGRGASLVYTVTALTCIRVVAAADRLLLSHTEGRGGRGGRGMHPTCRRPRALAPRDERDATALAADAAARSPTSPSV